MSVLRCDRCPNLIDTDEEPEAYIADRWLCEPCREQYLDDMAVTDNADAAADEEWLEGRTK
jgi:hypothetical protein